ncbi:MULTISPECIES: hypothetical protein [Azospirillaceae]|uniref:hypothetical protein n=1 Tax=Azospirillaceae TaxID=2829815 RepID=UPI000B66EB71|nr:MULTISPECIES: hypothetical protein [Azospirillaceae]MDG5496970.1 hypothetical protein [Niveispirillum sp. BGYR6]SNS83772.1 hypothetical protein SAMN05880556_11325 [Azospirillum sp. RU38E]SNT00975.1 hypothetical protein SAMN05880591_11324 [Azospirillum sp. RU37A]
MAVKTKTPAVAPAAEAPPPAADALLAGDELFKAGHGGSYTLLPDGRRVLSKE